MKILMLIVSLVILVSGCSGRIQKDSGVSWATMDGNGHWVNRNGEIARQTDWEGCEKLTEKYLELGWVFLPGYAIAHSKFQDCMKDLGYAWKVD